MTKADVYGVAVECLEGCDLDEIAVIVQEARPMLALAGVDLESFDGRVGYAVVGKIQARIQDMVDAPDPYHAFDDDDWGGADAVLGFLIVVRDAILSHRDHGTVVRVTT